jgi:hypothetical protein
MLRSHFLRRLLSWLALAAILGFAAAPTLARLLARPDAQQWMQICSAQGSRLVAAADLAPQRPAAPAQPQLEHCPFCALHAALLPTPQASHTLALPQARPARYPQLFLDAPRSLRWWSVAHPRGPPRLH